MSCDVYVKRHVRNSAWLCVSLRLGLYSRNASGKGGVGLDSRIAVAASSILQNGHTFRGWTLNGLSCSTCQRTTSSCVCLYLFWSIITKVTLNNCLFSFHTHGHCGSDCPQSLPSKSLGIHYCRHPLICIAQSELLLMWLNKFSLIRIVSGPPCGPVVGVLFQYWWSSVSDPDHNHWS
jgi:hypothetical protein